MKIVVWTDGSCNANGVHGRGGWSALIEQAGTAREISGYAHGTTHNRMELTAICEALKTLTGAIEVRTDSTYVEKCFNKSWHERWLREGSWKGSSGRAVKNRDLWERLFRLVWEGKRDVDFVWIKGHAGDLNNHRVDRLARAAVLSARLTPLAQNAAPAPAPKPKPTATKTAKSNWRPLDPIGQMEYLHAHPTIPDSAWTNEQRKKGEKRAAFVVRILG